MKKILQVSLSVLLVGLLVSPAAFAKKDGDPAGWMKGEKKGWHGENTPPGLSKKEAKKAEKEARKKAKEAEKKTKQAQKEAKRKAQEAEREARKKAKAAQS